MRVQKYNFDGTQMNQLNTVFLEKVRFHLPLGLYPGEKLCGNEILVSLKVTFPAEASNERNPWLNYERLLSIISKNTEKPLDLLEELAQHMLNDVQSECSEFKPVQIEVVIEKPQLPVVKYQAESAGVHMIWRA
jgi:dihydroneopterin aldolase